MLVIRLPSSEKLPQEQLDLISSNAGVVVVNEKPNTFCVLENLATLLESKKIPFEVVEEYPEWSDERAMAAIQRSLDDIEAGRGEMNPPLSIAKLATLSQRKRQEKDINSLSG